MKQWLDQHDDYGSEEGALRDYSFETDHWTQLSKWLTHKILEGESTRRIPVVYPLLNNQCSRTDDGRMRWPNTPDFGCGEKEECCEVECPTLKSNDIDRRHSILSQMFDQVREDRPVRFEFDASDPDLVCKINIARIVLRSADARNIQVEKYSGSPQTRYSPFVRVGSKQDVENLLIRQSEIEIPDEDIMFTRSEAAKNRSRYRKNKEKRENYQNLVTVTVNLLRVMSKYDEWIPYFYGFDDRDVDSCTLSFEERRRGAVDESDWQFKITMDLRKSIEAKYVTEPIELDAIGSYDAIMNRQGKRPGAEEWQVLNTHLIVGVQLLYKLLMDSTEHSACMTVEENIQCIGDLVSLIEYAEDDSTTHEGTQHANRHGEYKRDTTYRFEPPGPWRSAFIRSIESATELMSDDYVQNELEYWSSGTEKDD